MKRNMDLIREILMQIEERQHNIEFAPLEIEGHSEEEMSHHIMLLDEAGLIQAEDLSAFGGHEWRVRRLTWWGHEFLDACRDDKRWDTAKKVMNERTGGLSFEVLKQLLVQLMEDAVFGG